MPISVNTDQTSLNTRNNLNESQKSLQRNFSRLSSGLAVQTARDDAARLAISLKAVSELQGLSQAERNANDALSVAQVAEGALQEVGNIFSRARELSIQSANGSLSATDRKALQSEFNQLQNQLKDIVETEFNDVSLFQGDVALEFQVGPESGQISTFSLNEAIPDISSLDISTAVSAQNSIQALDAAIDDLSLKRAEVGAFQSGVESNIRNLQVSQEKQAVSLSRIRDTDYAKETAELTKNSIKTEIGIAVQAQANVNRAAALQLLKS